MKKYSFLSSFILVVFLGVFLVACSSSETDTESDTDTDIEIDTSSFDEEETSTFEESDSPYTDSELESDPSAPSTNPNDYNSDGEYVPEDGPTDNPADYNSNGEYKPADEMTQDEIQAELESMFEDNLGQ